MLSWLLGGGAVPLLLIGVGTFFTFYLKGQPLVSPRRMLQALFTPAPAREGTRVVSPLGAMSLALAGTLGVGNIVGVANAIWVGGAGAIFWMWVCALFAMVLKYAEILLAVSHRREHRNGSFFGGTVYYIRDCFSSRGMVRVGSILSAVFAILMIVDALGMGCVIQVNAVSMALSGVWGIPTYLSGAVLVLLSLPVLLRGAHGASKLTELLVPIMSAGYIILSVAVLLLRWQEVPDAVRLIFSEAFSPRGAAGGVLGFLTSRAIRAGAMRGLLSNEAGCGTAPTAHASANAASPAAQGIFGILEVFVDTILLCSATALVLLVSWDQVEMLGADSVMMSIRAYSAVLGGWSEGFFALCVACFGYATVICWGQYGLQSLRALSRKPIYTVLYFVLMGVSIFIGAVAPPQSVWGVADAALGMMTVINLCMLLVMRREIKEQTQRFAEQGRARRSPASANRR